MLSYFLIPYQHFVLGKIISGYSVLFHEPYLVNKVSIINSIFLSSLNIMLFKVNDSGIKKLDNWTKSNSIIFFCSLLVILPLIHFGASGETILNSSYGATKSEKSAIYEYVAVFFIIPILFTNKSKLQLFFLYGCLFFYISKTLMYGSRLEMIQSGLLFFFFFYNYARDISKKKLIVTFLFLIFTVKLLGMIRSNPVEFLYYITDVGLFWEYLTRGNDSLYIQTNSGDVYYASMRLIGLIDTGVMSITDRLLSLCSFIFNLPLSLSDYKTYANLASYKSDIYPTGGGGLTPVYFFVWLGYFGVVIGAIFIGYIFRQFHYSNNMYFRIYGLSLLITFPRWFPYSPIGFMKISIIITIFYFVCLSLSTKIKDIKG